MGEEEERKVSTYETYITPQANERTVLLVRGGQEETWQEKLGLHEPRQLNFWRHILGEFVVTLIFTMIACGCTLNFGSARSELHQALCVGFAVAALTSVSVEGFGFFNPAISFGLLLLKQIKPVRFVFYVAIQIAGSVAGAGLLYLYTPENARGQLGALSLHEGLPSGIGFVIEMTLTFLLMWVVCAAMDPEKNLNGFQAPLSVGVAVIVAMLMGMPFTGAAVNPIRAFGPGIVMDILDDHWVYWIGPLVGALVAVFSYEYVFKPSTEAEKPKPRNDLPAVHLQINANSSV